MEGLVEKNKAKKTIQIAILYYSYRLIEEKAFIFLTYYQFDFDPC